MIWTVPAAGLSPPERMSETAFWNVEGVALDVPGRGVAERILPVAPRGVLVRRAAQPAPWLGQRQQYGYSPV
mgnify:CR=1 FL=1